MERGADENEKCNTFSRSLVGHARAYMYVPQKKKRKKDSQKLKAKKRKLKVVEASAPLKILIWQQLFAACSAQIASPLLVLESIVLN